MKPSTVLSCVENMGKVDRTHPKLHFEQRKSRLREPTPEGSLIAQTDMPEPVEGDIRNILAAMQKSLSIIDSKIDSLA